MATWPDLTDYHEALQFPQRSLGDPELQKAQIDDVFDHQRRRERPQPQLQIDRLAEPRQIEFAKWIAGLHQQSGEDRSHNEFKRDVLTGRRR